MESVPLTEKTWKGHRVHHPICAWLCARTRNREWERNISPAQLCTGPGDLHHTTLTAHTSQQVQLCSIPWDSACTHTLLCFKAEEADDTQCIISDTEYFIPMQQHWRWVGRINWLKCRTGNSRWRRKTIHNQKPLLPFLSSLWFTFNARWSQAVFTTEISHSRKFPLPISFLIWKNPNFALQ